MSRAGCPYDNALMEHYYNTLKSEHINHFDYNTKEALDSGVNDFAYVSYKHVLPHTYNKGEKGYNNDNKDLYDYYWCKS